MNVHKNTRRHGIPPQLYMASHGLGPLSGLCPHMIPSWYHVVHVFNRHWCTRAQDMSTWTDELRLCECMYKGSTYNALYHCIKVNIYERIWPHMRQMVGRELGESLVAKLVSSTSWENLRPATSRGSATSAKQLLPWTTTPPLTILSSSPSRICSWSMLSVQDYCCPRFATDLQYIIQDIKRQKIFLDYHHPTIQWHLRKNEME